MLLSSSVQNLNLRTVEKGAIKKKIDLFQVNLKCQLVNWQLYVYHGFANACVLQVQYDMCNAGLGAPGR